MLACPRCSSRLIRQATAKGVVYLCARCGGKAAPISDLRQTASRDFMQGLVQEVKAGPPQGRPCPHCLRRMHLARFPGADNPLVVDVCGRCHLVWFDPSEHEQVPRRTMVIPRSAQVAPSGSRQAPARVEMEEGKPRRDQPAPMQEGVRGWQYLPALLGLPVELSAPAILRAPLVTWGLSAVMTAILALMVQSGTEEAAITAWGFVPNHWWRHGGLTLVTGFFLHAGWLHLIGNLYFFMIFGDNVEDQLGKGRFILLLLVSHVAGNALHAMLDPRGDIPCVGASAGIAGVMAYYATAFPHARIGVLFRLFFWIRLRAIWWLALYVGLQFYGAWEQVGGLSNVSALAHLGGIAVGFTAALSRRILTSDHRQT
jgi:membrane associated rhomboid family serine protease